MRAAIVALAISSLALPAQADEAKGFVQPTREEMKKIFGLHWQKQLFERLKSDLNAPERQLQAPSISLDGAIGYAGTERGDLFAVWMSSGREVWKKPAFGSIGRAMGHFQNDLLVGVNAELVALEGYTGREKWRLDLGGEIGGPLTVTGTVALVPIRSQTFAAIDVVQGKLLWRAKRPKIEGITVRGQAQPTVDPARQRAYIGFADGSLMAVELEAGRTQWVASLGKRGEVFSDVDTRPILGDRGAVLYAASYNGGLYALEAETGRVLWKNDALTHLVGLTRVSTAPGLLVGVIGDGEAVGIDLDGGKVRWRFRLKGGVPTTPTDVGDGYVMFGVSEGPLMVLSASDGKPAQQINPGSGMLAMPAFRGKNLLIYTAYGRMLAGRRGGGEGFSF